MHMTMMTPLAEVAYTAEIHDSLAVIVRSQGTTDTGWPVYVTTRTAWQVDHDHHFMSPTKQGDTTCEGCGAEAWSLNWVKPGIYSEQTGEWVQMMLGILDERVTQTERIVAEAQMGVIAIDGNPVTDEPLSTPEEKCSFALGNGMYCHLPSQVNHTHPGARDQREARDVILAVTVGSEPARRSGIPIPTMRLGVLN